MAHLIDMSNFRANMAYVGTEVPWHGLGQKMPINAPLEQWVTQAGFGWEAKKGQGLFRDEEGTVHESQNVVLYRSDTKYELGTVTSRYNVVQPKEVIEFYRDIVQLEGWNIETAGCLDGGKRIWALAKANGDDFIVADSRDKVETYLLLATSYDGKMATIGKFTSVRVVCQNTLTMSLGDQIASIRVPHSRTFNPGQMKLELGIHTQAALQFKEEAEALAKLRMTDKTAMKFIKDILAGETETDDLSTRKANIIQSVFKLYDGGGKGSNLTSANGTAWGVLNAITEYTNHHVNSRSVNNRMKSAWFGQNEQLALTAKSQLLAMVA